ncbi:MAG: DUF58 domain-containing protein [Planctomycetota bacterium]
MLRSERPTRPTSIEELIDPQLMARIGRLDLASARIFAGKLKGERRSKKRGESVEFADHRPYSIGDDLRHIDWNIYARLDRFFLKLFLEEEDLSLHIVLDASLSTDCGDPNKFEFMRRLAAALAYIGLVNLNRVAITTLGGRIVTPGVEDDERAGDASPDPGEDGASVMHQLRDLRGRRRLSDLSRFLCAIEPEGNTRFDRAAKRLAITRRGRGVMVVLSDFFMKEGYETALRMLVGRGYDVYAMQVLSPQEIEPEGPGGIAGDLRLRDVEDADRAEITVSAPLLKRYKQNLAAYNDALRTFCARREINMSTVRTDTELDVFIVDYLRRRGLLR